MEGHECIGEILASGSQIGEEARNVASAQQNKRLEQLHLFIIVDKLKVIFK
jgi:hypothetical protein